MSLERSRAFTGHRDWSAARSLPLDRGVHERRAPPNRTHDDEERGHRDDNSHHEDEIAAIRHRGIVEETVAPGTRHGAGSTMLAAAPGDDGQATN